MPDKRGCRAYIRTVSLELEISPNRRIPGLPPVHFETRTKWLPLHKVILVNDNFTSREFVVLVLKAVFRMDEGQASKVMMTAHQRGACVVAVVTWKVAEEKATLAADTVRKKDTRSGSRLRQRDSG